MTGGLLTFFCVFFFNDTATTEIYTLSLHDALPISIEARELARTLVSGPIGGVVGGQGIAETLGDRKSTRLNSSHSQISYAVFCLKKKKKTKRNRRSRPVSRSLCLPNSSRLASPISP